MTVLHVGYLLPLFSEKTSFVFEDEIFGCSTVGQLTGFVGMSPHAISQKVVDTTTHFDSSTHPGLEGRIFGLKFDQTESISPAKEHNQENEDLMTIHFLSKISYLKKTNSDVNFSF